MACGPDSPSPTSLRESGPAEVALPAPVTAQAATPQYAGPIEKPPAALTSTTAPQPESASTANSQGPTAVAVQPQPSAQREPPVESESPAGLPLPRAALTVEPAQPLPPANTSTISRDPSPIPAGTTPAQSTTSIQPPTNTPASQPAPEAASSPFEPPPPPSPAPAATPAQEPDTSPPAVPSAVPSSLSDNPQTESAPIDESLEQAPSFTLPTVGGGTASLDSYLGQRNLVLVFYRAFW